MHSTSSKPAVLRPSQRPPLPAVQQQLGDIPPECGVYRFFGREGQVLYIGKAVNLRRRVRQYFGPARTGWDSRIRSMVSGIHDLDWIRTSTELEALLLEDTLIKRYWPDFNTRQKKILLHAYLSLSNDLYPVFTVKDRAEVDRSATPIGSILFGPQKDLYYARDLLESVNTVLGLRICSDPLPHRFCVYGRRECLAPCSGQVDPDRYRKRKSEKPYRFLPVPLPD
jgi:excinuclease ABC subunit C